ncbi:MAG: ribose 5-phosphate isomerase [Clostridiales bacterium]|jgi:ribose 5-phosphate isomerase B|nr:ribose 5-phosphate isomerase [Clostridiales bacterium]
MKIAIGSDHAGLEMKSEILLLLKEMQIEYKDFGTFSKVSCDYPDIAYSVSTYVANSDVNRGILVCGTGIGMSIAANKIHGIRAALCHDEFSAKMARAHNNSNVLTLGARVVGQGLANEIIRVWLTTEYEGGRHDRRVEKINHIEGEN